jgi:hydroxysqualene dehydroxylase
MTGAGPERTSVVVGGGLAGVSAALRLADAGRRVVLLEKKPRLGGRAFSFTRDGMSIDNGQHVFLRCCTAYQWFLRRIGARAETVLQSHLDIPVLAAGGQRARIARIPGVPAPLHLGATIAGYRVLGPRDRARIGRAALALKRLDPADRSLDDRTLGDFLRAHGQNDATIEALWSIVATATLNLPPDDASLALAVKVFRTGLLDSAPASDVGHAAVPLGRVHDEAATKALVAAGVEVLLDHSVRAIESGPTGPVVRADGPDIARTWDAEDVVLAVAHSEAGPALAGPAAESARALGSSPIVNVHVVYDRPVTDLAFAAGIGSPVQWFFDRTESSGVARRHPGAQYLAVTVSAASNVIDRPSRDVVDQFGPELARLLPAAAGATVVDAFVTREREATFRQAPGSWRHRPGPDGGPAGVWLAGAWTDTGWPDTMEGAVRSGVSAAEAALRISPYQAVEYAA